MPIYLKIIFGVLILLDVVAAIMLIDKPRPPRTKVQVAISTLINIAFLAWIFSL